MTNEILLFHRWTLHSKGWTGKNTKNKTTVNGVKVNQIFMFDRKGNDNAFFRGRKARAAKEKAIAVHQQ